MRTQCICVALAVVLLRSFASAQWVQTNGPFWGGRITALAVSPSSLFAVTEDGWSSSFVYRSTDYGKAWVRVFTGVGWPSGSLCLIAFGNEVLVGTSQGDIFYSSNEGQTWIQRSSLNAYFTSFSCFDDSAGNTTLIAGTDRTGIYSSTDKGVTWLERGVEGHTVTSLQFCGTDLFVGCSDGICHSSNFGAAWDYAASYPVWVNTLALLWVGNGTANLFAGIDHGILRSTDRGASWDWVPGLWNANVSAFAVSGTNLFAGTDTGGVFLSTDEGVSWNSMDTGLTSRMVRALVFSPDGEGSVELFAGTVGGGIFSSTTSGISWSAANTGLVYSDVSCLTGSGTSLFAGTYQGGIFFSTDNGTNWKAVNASFTTGRRVNAFAFSGPDVYAGVDGGGTSGLFRSTDDGTSWTEVYTGYIGGSVLSLATSFNEAGGTYLFAGTDVYGMIRSSDNGTNWSRTYAAGDEVYSLALSGANLYARTDMGIFRSTDDGANWSIVKEGGFTSIAVSPAEMQRADVFAAASNGDVLVSTDGGTSWDAASNLYSERITGLVYFPATGGGTSLVAGTETGSVAMSGNRGATWQEAGGIREAGWMYKRVSSFVVSDTDLFCATLGGGVCKRPLSELVAGVKESATGLSTEYRLDQNYPNPFNPSTKIRYELVKSSFVKLTVYDILGREVAVLVNEREAPGSYEVRFDASALSSGVYFYRLTAGPFGATRKLVLVR